MSEKILDVKQFLNKKYGKVLCSYGMDKCKSCSNNLGNCCIWNLIDSLVNYYIPEFHKDHFEFIEFMLDNFDLSKFSNEQIKMLNIMKEMIMSYKEGLDNG